MYVQSMPKMPGGDDGEKKEETAESREEAKEQVSQKIILSHHYLPYLLQERLKQQAIKEAEKERADFYAKQKESQKAERAKYREKV